MDDVTARIAASPLPTATDLRRRRSIVYQLLRFIAINLRIVQMVIRGHRDLDQPAARP